MLSMHAFHIELPDGYSAAGVVAWYFTVVLTNSNNWGDKCTKVSIATRMNQCISDRRGHTLLHSSASVVMSPVWSWLGSCDGLRLVFWGKWHPTQDAICLSKVLTIDYQAIFTSMGLLFQLRRNFSWQECMFDEIVDILPGVSWTDLWTSCSWGLFSP